jgi:hypothetical protein
MDSRETSDIINKKNNDVESNDDAPEFTKDIRKKSHKEELNIPLDINYDSLNTFTANVPIESNGIYKEPSVISEEKERPSYFETAAAQFKHMNDTWHLLHAGYTQTQKPLLTPPDPNFNPKDFEENFVNIKPEYYNYLLDSQSEQDMNFRLNRIYREQKLQEDIENGSWIPYLVGGGFGMATDLTNLIPFVSWAKYANWGKTILMSMARAAPGMVAYGAVSSAAEQLDSINGNFSDFLTNAIVATTFGTVLFGLGGVASLSADKLALWDLKKFAKEGLDGINWKLKVDKNNKVTGMEAFDETGTLSADKVKIAQDMADSTFSKTGVFKVPYLNTALINFLGNRYFGSPIISMLNSTYKVVRYVADLSYDHGLWTEGMDKGKPNPDKFFTLMKETFSEIRAQRAQINAMYLERNGFDISSPTVQGVIKSGLYAREKISALVGQKGNATIPLETFYNEIETVLHSEVSSQHAPVNDAAALLRKSMDKYYREWRTAYNLPDDWLPPITAKGYLMRVYDTNFLNNNEGKWIKVISDELKNQDNLIIQYMEPIKQLESQIADHIEQHAILTKKPNVSDAEIKISSDELEALRIKKSAEEEKLQNEIRSNSNLHLLSDDWHALSADEAAELKLLLRPRDVAQTKVDELKQVISQLQTNVGKAKSASLKGKTAQTAQKHQAAQETSEAVLKKAKEDLIEAQLELSKEEQILQGMAARGQIDRKFYTVNPKSNIVKFKEPGERLKFRKTYHEQEGYIADEEAAHKFREEHAKAYYDTITNQTAEDTINQIMGKFTGNTAENHTKERTLNIPDKVLYDNKFLTKDLMAKVANYQSWLARRTHLKNVYRNATLEGGFENLIKVADEEFQAKRTILNDQKSNIENDLLNANLTENEKKKLEKKLEKANKELTKETKRFNRAKFQLNFMYEKMMGISRLSKGAKQFESAAKSAAVASNLGFLFYTFITDLSANGLKHGILPFLHSALYPMIESMGGILKTANSESFRNGCAALNLALQHVSAATTERNIGLETNPTLNLGKIPAALEWLAHVGSNFSLANAGENMLQRFTSNIAQSEIIRISHAILKGTESKRDIRWYLRYGLDPKEDAEKIVKAFKADGGGKTFLGSYQSNFWHWQDMPTANKVSKATFRATHDTVINAHSFDTPFWTDSNGAMGVMGPIFKGFNGWAFASLNRYVVPMMQKPDATQFIGVIGMLAAGALVSPTRRMAVGEDPYPPGMTQEQWMYEVLSDSAFFSYFMTVLNDANVLTQGGLLGDLKNDKYRDRTRAGLLGPTIGNANSMANFFTALASGQMNQSDALKMARMIPLVNSSWTWWMSKKLIESFDLPKNRYVAERQKG